MSKIFDVVLNYFGYVNKQVVDKVITKAIASDKPARTNIEQDDDFSANQQNLDYWSKKVKDVLYVDDTDRIRYTELHTMDCEVPEISASLDVNADFIVYPNDQDRGRVVAVTCETKPGQKKIDEIEQRSCVQEQLYPMVRAMLKYGDNAEEIVTNVDGNKFMGFRNIPVKTLVPIMNDGFPSQDPRMMQYIAGKLIATLKDSEVFHLCLNTDRERYCKYGKGVSMVEHSRLLYRQLHLMEEGMMITRLARANQNYAIVVDVGELQGEEALAFLDHYKKRLMRRKYIDQNTGKWSWEYNPLSVIEDIMIPTRAGSGGNVIPLNNGNNTGKDIKDILYCQDKLIYSTGTPKLLIGKEVDINSKATSDSQMGTFLRRIRRIQTIITPEIKGLYQKLLKIEGVNVSLDQLEVHWPVSLTVDEERKMTIEKIKMEIAKILKVELKVIDSMYIYTKILGMTVDEAEALKLATKIEREDEADELAAAQPVDVPDEEPEEEAKPDKAPTKEELIAVIKEKLSKQEYKEWEKMQNIVKKNPVLGTMVIDLINVLQSTDGN